MSSLESLTSAAAVHPPVFRRVLLAHTGEDPEIDLLDFAALLSASETTIAAYPFDGILRSMATAARMRFEALGGAAPVLRALPDLDFDWILDAARDSDLLIARRSSAARCLLSKSPCSVCLAPQRLPARIERVLAGIHLDDTGYAVLERAASLCRIVGASELFAVHCCSPDVNLDLSSAQSEEFRSNRMLELYRFMAQAKLDGVSCTPVLEDSLDPRRALARVAREREADLIVVGRHRDVAPRVALALANNAGAPIMQIVLPPREEGVRGLLRRVFSHSEPKFN